MRYLVLQVLPVGFYFVLNATSDADCTAAVSMAVVTGLSYTVWNKVYARARPGLNTALGAEAVSIERRDSGRRATGGKLTFWRVRKPGDGVDHLGVDAAVQRDALHAPVGFAAFHGAALGDLIARYAAPFAALRDGGAVGAQPAPPRVQNPPAGTAACLSADSGRTTDIKLTTLGAASGEGGEAAWGAAVVLVRHGEPPVGGVDQRAEVTLKAEAVANALPSAVKKQLVYSTIVALEEDGDDGTISVGSALGGAPRSYVRMTANRGLLDAEGAVRELSDRSIRRRSSQLKQVFDGYAVEGPRVLAGLGRREPETWRQAEELLHRGPFELSREKTYVLYQRMLKHGASDTLFRELTAFFREEAGARVLLGSKAYLRARARAVAITYDVMKMSLQFKDGAGAQLFEKPCIVSQASSVEDVVEKDYAEIGDCFLARAIGGRQNSVTVALMCDKGQGWTTTILVMLNKENALSAQNASILSRFAKAPDSYENMRRCTFYRYGPALKLFAEGAVDLVFMRNGRGDTATSVVPRGTLVLGAVGHNDAFHQLPSSLEGVCAADHVGVAALVYESGSVVGVAMLGLDVPDLWTTARVRDRPGNKRHTVSDKPVDLRTMMPWQHIFEYLGHESPFDLCGFAPLDRTRYSHIFKIVAYRPLREPVSGVVCVSTKDVNLMGAGDNENISHMIGHQGHSATMFSWANYATLKQLKASDGRRVLTSSSAAPPQRRLREIRDDAKACAEACAKEGADPKACAVAAHSITLKPLTPVCPAFYAPTILHLFLGIFMLLVQTLEIELGDVDGGESFTDKGDARRAMDVACLAFSIAELQLKQASEARKTLSASIQSLKRDVAKGAAAGTGGKKGLEALQNRVVDVEAELPEAVDLEEQRKRELAAARALKKQAFATHQKTVGTLEHGLGNSFDVRKVQRQAFYKNTFNGNHIWIALDNAADILNALLVVAARMDEVDKGHKYLDDVKPIVAKHLKLWLALRRVKLAIRPAEVLDEAEVQEACDACRAFGILFCATFPERDVTPKLWALFFEVRRRPLVPRPRAAARARRPTREHFSTRRCRASSRASTSPASSPRTPASPSTPSRTASRGASATRAATSTPRRSSCTASPCSRTRSPAPPTPPSMRSASAAPSRAS